MHHFTDGSNTASANEISNNPPVADDSTQSQYDMGGSDFGLTDSSSWDDSSAGDSGGDDW